MNAHEKVLQLHKEMREEILEAGVQDSHYDFLIKDLEKKEIGVLLSFFEEMYGGHYKDLLIVRAYRPKEFWYNLKYLYKQHRFHEQMLLRAEQKRIRKAFRRFSSNMKGSENGKHSQQEEKNDAPIEDRSQEGTT